MNHPRVIVVGAGGISRAWFPPLKELGCQVVGVVDLRLEAAEQAITDWELDKAVASDDLAKTLAEIKADFLVDLTIPEAHCGVTCSALKAGLHVIGEKPMAASMEQARQMVAAAEAADRIYMVSQSRRWDPNHEAMRQIVRSGTLGQITTATCQFYLGAHFGGFRAAMDHVLLLDMAIHHFDLARMVTAKDPISVYAEEYNPRGSWFSHGAAAMCIFEMSDNVRFAYNGSWCSEGQHTSWNGNWRLVCEQGSVSSGNDSQPHAHIVSATEGLVRHPNEVEVPIPSLPGHGQRGAILEMMRYLEKGVVPQCECHDNIYSLAMVFAAIESAQTGKRVEIASLIN